MLIEQFSMSRILHTSFDFQFLNRPPFNSMHVCNRYRHHRHTNNKFIIIFRRQIIVLVDKINGIGAGGTCPPPHFQKGGQTYTFASFFAIIFFSSKISLKPFYTPPNEVVRYYLISSIWFDVYVALESLRNLQKQTQSIFWNVSAVYNFEFVKEWIQDFVYRYRPKNPFLFLFRIFPLVVLPI